MIMNSERIKEIQETTAYPKSLSVYKALLQVWNECQQENNRKIEADNESLCIHCKKEKATHGIGLKKVVCGECWNELIK